MIKWDLSLGSAYTPICVIHHVNKKKDKTFIMDNLSKKSFNRSILSSPLKTCKYVNNIYLFKSLVL